MPTGTETTDIRTTTTRSTVTHISPQKRDMAYNVATEEAALAVTVHFADGRTEPSLLLLTPGQVEFCRIQVDAATKKRYMAEQGRKDEER